MDHLPECPCYLAVRENVCLCDRLRACEQRVLAQAVSDLTAQYNYGVTVGRDRARDAVAALRDRTGTVIFGQEFVPVDTALAAIDALHETV